MHFRVEVHSVAGWHVRRHLSLSEMLSASFHAMQYRPCRIRIAIDPIAPTRSEYPEQPCTS